MSSLPPAPRPKRPLMPFLILGGLALLFLSWLAFMGHYLREEAYKKSIRQSDPALVLTNTAAGAPPPSEPTP